MKKVLLNALAFPLVIALCFSCKKKDTGNCRCHYYSGDVKNYDLSSLPKSQQSDSCSHLGQLAGGFGGDCDLE